MTALIEMDLERIKALYFEGLRHVDIAADIGKKQGHCGNAHSDDGSVWPIATTAKGQDHDAAQVRRGASPSASRRRRSYAV